MDPVMHTLWQREALRLLEQKLTFIERLLPQSPPVSFWRGQWNLLRYRVTQLRERLGEIIAGRRFDE